MFRRGYEYVKNSRMYYQPKTPFAALKAAEAGLLPPEAFIFKATSIEPISDSPENLEEIERILAQKNRDLETNKLLMDLLGKLIKHPDKEIALFAAESINAIESSYNAELEALKDDQHRERANLFIERAELSRASADLMKFYLREAFASFRILEKNRSMRTEDYISMAGILTELGLLPQAEKTLLDNQIDSVEAMFLLAEIAFKKRDYTGLYRIVDRLSRKRSLLDINQLSLVDFWMDNK